MSDFRRTVARMRALERKTILPAHSQIETDPTLVSCESPLGPVLQTRLFIPAHTVERKQPIFIGLPFRFRSQMIHPFFLRALPRTPILHVRHFYSDRLLARDLIRSFGLAHTAAQKRIDAPRPWANPND